MLFTRGFSTISRAHPNSLIKFIFDLNEFLILLFLQYSMTSPLQVETL
jgi:hypothetical protein